MTPDQQIAQLSIEWPEWHIWRGRDRDGAPHGWHATTKPGTKATILSASSPEELGKRLRGAECPQTAALS